MQLGGGLSSMLRAIDVSLTSSTSFRLGDLTSLPTSAITTVTDATDLCPLPPLLHCRAHVSPPRDNPGRQSSFILACIFLGVVALADAL